MPALGEPSRRKRSRDRCRGLSSCNATPALNRARSAPPAFEASGVPPIRRCSSAARCGDSAIAIAPADPVAVQVEVSQPAELARRERPGALRPDPRERQPQRPPSGSIPKIWIARGLPASE